MTSITSPAQALWKQKDRLGKEADRIRALAKTVGRPSDFAGFQWLQVMAFALEFQPNLILELGRGHGNSTCCFLEVARLLGPAYPCRVVSLCLSDEWQKQTVPRLQRFNAPEWFQAGKNIQRDIVRCDPSALLEDADRCLVLWDAHGFEIAEWVLGKLAPCLLKRQHVVVMHDISDLRYCAPPWNYGESGLWQGENAQDAFFCLGHVCSHVAQAISIVDFTTRNHFPLHSADESLNSEIGASPDRVATLLELFGSDLFSLQAHWCWFSLNEAPGPLTFPRVQRKDLLSRAEADSSFSRSTSKWWARARRLVGAH